VVGRVVAIHVTDSAGQPMRRLDEVVALPGRGLAGDRYAEGVGFYSQRELPGGARELTLFEVETAHSTAYWPPVWPAAPAS